MTTPWWLRTLIALDALLQVMWRRGTPGVTMSSRIGTAAAHGKTWGKAAFWCLDNTRWLGFGRDPVTDESHCIGAMRNDVLRSEGPRVELLDDPVVVKFAGLDDLVVKFNRVAKDAKAE